MADLDPPDDLMPVAGHAPETVDPDSEAEYTLEYGVVCPKCGTSLKTLKVVRLLRTRVNFVSALPRRGQVLICPSCRSVLGGELTFL